MKNLTNKTFLIRYFKYLIFTLPILFFVGCDLEEEPPFLDETIYTDSQSAQAARDGIYQALTTYNTQERRLFITNLYSGLMFTGKGGNRVNTCLLYTSDAADD